MEEVRQLLGKTSLELLTLEEEDRVQAWLAARLRGVSASAARLPSSSAAAGGGRH